MLSQRYAPETLNLVSKTDWHPYPTAQERTFWDALPDPVRQAYIRGGEEALTYTWPSLPATLFLEVARIGNRVNYETLNFERRRKLLDLVLAECVEGQGRFVDAAVNGLWLICEESYWGVPAHLTMQRAGRGLPDTAERTVDLFVAETSSLLAYALYLLRPQLDTLSPLIVPRIEREITERVLIPNLERDDFGWMGFANPEHRPNNWNPWIHSNWLISLLLVEPDTERRRAAVAKIMRSLDKFIDPYPADGGCDEGPGYWGRAGASLYECLELLYQATDGQVNVFDQPLVQEMGRFIYRVQVSEDYFVNFADAAAIIRPDAALIFNYGQRIHDPDMRAMGAWLAQRQHLFAPLEDTNRDTKRPSKSIARELPMLQALDKMAAHEAYPPLPRDVWLPEIEVMTARDTVRTAEGFYVAAKGGHNAESHNHNDIGQFVVYMDGLPVLIDAGVETYSVKTFSDQRYEIWTMQSGYHNLPTVNGVTQSPGEQFAARDVDYRVDDTGAIFRLDIAGAYPPEAEIQSWQRVIRLQRGQEVSVEDIYTLTQTPRSLRLNLLTPCTVNLDTPGSIQLDTRPLVHGRMAGKATLYYDADKFSAAVEPIAIEDALLRNAWGTALYRIVLTANAPLAQDRWMLHITR